MCTSTKSSSRSLKKRAFVILKTSRLCRRYRGRPRIPRIAVWSTCVEVFLSKTLNPKLLLISRTPLCLPTTFYEWVNRWICDAVKVEIGFLIAVHLTQDWWWQASLIESSSCIIITITWSTSPESHWSVHIHFKMIKMWRERIWWTTHSRFWN